MAFLAKTQFIFLNTANSVFTVCVVTVVVVVVVTAQNARKLAHTHTYMHTRGHTHTCCFEMSSNVRVAAVLLTATSRRRTKSYRREKRETATANDGESV